MEMEIMMLFGGAVAITAISLSLFWHGNQNICKNMKRLELTGDFDWKQTPLMKTRRGQVRAFLSAGFIMGGLLVSIPLLMMTQQVELVISLFEALSSAFLIGYLLGSMFLLIYTLVSLTDSLNIRLSDLIQEDKLKGIVDRKGYSVPQVIHFEAKNPEAVQEIIDKMPIMEDIWKLQQLKSELDGRANTMEQRKVLEDVNQLLKEKQIHMYRLFEVIYEAVSKEPPAGQNQALFEKAALTIESLKEAHILSEKEVNV